MLYLKLVLRYFVYKVNLPTVAKGHNSEKWINGMLPKVNKAIYTSSPISVLNTEALALIRFRYIVHKGKLHQSAKSDNSFKYLSIF